MNVEKLWFCVKMISLHKITTFPHSTILLLYHKMEWNAILECLLLYHKLPILWLLVMTLNDFEPLFCFTCKYRCLYSVSKQQNTWFLVITSANVDRFSKSFADITDPFLRTAVLFSRFYSHFVVKRFRTWAVKVASYLGRWIMRSHMQYAIEIGSNCDFQVL